MDYRDKLTIELCKPGSKPCVRRLRITIYYVLESLASGMTPREIIEDLPEPELDDIVDRTRALMATLALKYAVSINRVFVTLHNWQQGQTAREEAVAAIPIYRLIAPTM